MQRQGSRTKREETENKMENNANTKEKHKHIYYRLQSGTAKMG